MTRIAGTTIPGDKKIAVALTHIYGIGPSLSKKIINEAKVDKEKRTSEFSDEEINRLREVIEKKYTTEGELRRQKRESVERLKRIGCYRGVRHKKSLPVRGQNTRTNSRTVRGNIKKTAGSGRKAPPSPK